jgi:hypothetical protein
MGKGKSKEVKRVQEDIEEIVDGLQPDGACSQQVHSSI